MNTNYDLVKEGTTLLKKKNIDEFGKLLDVSWKMKKKLHNEVSSPKPVPDPLAPTDITAWRALEVNFTQADKVLEFAPVMPVFENDVTIPAPPNEI